jgi:hypothetical protein
LIIEEGKFCSAQKAIELDKRNKINIKNKYKK